MAFELEEQQRRAVEHGSGPLLVVAGAGTGKTTVLVQRIARLIREKRARPDEILAVTYTDNAAALLRARVEAAVGKKCRNLQATTFHGYCKALLYRSQRDFRVLDENDLYVYLRRRISELPLDYYARAASPGQFLQTLLAFFDRCQDELVTASDYARYVEELATGKRPLPRVVPRKQLEAVSYAEVLARCREIAAVYMGVEQMLRQDGFGTFGHMISRAVELLDDDPQVLERERRRARFVLIDEFQDANLAQIELIQRLASHERNVFAVGDPDQAIYRFRGASSAAFAEFAKRFPQTRTVVLSRNQRSGPPVLNCACSVISLNREVSWPLGNGKSYHRHPLQSGRAIRAQERGELPLWPEVEVVACEDEQQEAMDLAASIEKLLLKRRSRSAAQAPRVGVLCRLHSHRESLVRELAARGIPYTVKGMNALETPAGRDLLAALRLLIAPHDTESLLRVAALPQFALNAEQVRDAVAAAPKDTKFVTVLERVPGGSAVLAAVSEARALVEAAARKAGAALELVVRRFAFDSSSPAIAAIKSFVAQWEKKPITRTGSVAEFFEYLDFYTEKGAAIEIGCEEEEDADPEVVRIMTVHAAKGMEFDHVFLPRLAPGSFPTNFRESLFEFPAELRKSVAAEGEGKEIHRQEERRLFYVGMTRARDSLTLFARIRRNAKPQGFVRDLVESEPARGWWRMRQPAAPKAALAAGEQECSGIGRWMLCPAHPRVVQLPLSATAIDTYDKCPLQYKLWREWPLERAVASMQFGNVMHTVLKDYYDALRVGRPRTREQVLEFFRQQIDGAHFEDPVQRELYLRDGTRQLSAFLELRQSEPPPDVLHTERTFELEIAGVLVRGRVDRIDRIRENRVAITDYKSGSVRSRQDAEKSLQLSIYAMAAREIWSFIPERLMFYNLADSSIVETARTEGQLDAARDVVRLVAARIADHDFAPRPGFHCRFCAYRRLCPATEQDVALPSRAAKARR